MKVLKTDNTLKENFNYPNKDFSFGIWTDNYNKLPNHTLTCHWHEDFEFGYLLTGSLDFIVSGKHIKINKGDYFFINSNVLHSAIQIHKAITNVYLFNSNIISHYDTTIYKKYVLPIISSDINFIKFNNTIKNYSNICKILSSLKDLDIYDYGYELKCQSLINTLWFELLHYIDFKDNSNSILKKDILHSEQVKLMLNFIHNNFSKKILINDLIKITNLSRSECFRSFKAITNKTITNYINEYRLANSINLLLNTNLSMTEIAYTCGFSNSSYFGELFKKVYGISPLKYKK